MQWIDSKKNKNRNKKKKAVLAFTMAGILMCTALDPALASDEWVEEAVILDLAETGEDSGSIIQASESDLQVQNELIGGIEQLSPDAEEMADEAFEAEPEGAEDEAPEAMPEVTEDKISEAVPEGAEDEVPEAMPEVTEDEISEAVPEGAEYEVPEVMPEGAEDEVSEVMPEGAEDEVLEAIPEGDEGETDEWLLEDIEIMDEEAVILDESELIAVQAAGTAVTAVASTAAPDLLGSIGTKNQWQIVAEGYSGREQSNKKGCDIDGDGLDDIFYQKNVVSTDIENEFRVYMGVTKRMTWDELLSECDFAITTAHKYKTIGELVDPTAIRGNSSTISPGKVEGARNYEATVTFTRGGKTVHTYTGWYHGTTSNCAEATGFIILSSIDKAMAASIGVNLHEDGSGSGGALEYTVNLDTMASQNILFSVDDIVVDSIADTMGDYITYEGVENSDGSYSYNDTTRTLTWTPASNGVTGVQVIENGGLTGYHYNIHQLVYKAQLNVEKDGFHSCAQNMNSKVGEQESYPVNQQAILNCHIDGFGSAQAQMQVPYVRGLLYDLEFQKVVQGSSIALEGITFTVTRKAGGSTYAEQLTYSDTQKTGADGWIKFHDLPWGEYTITETAYQDGDEFQNNYLEQLPKDLGSAAIGQTINSSALTAEHQGTHSCDQASDLKNKLFVYNSGKVENTPYRAKITIQKTVNEYSSLPGELQAAAYTMQIGSDDIYIKPQTDSVSTEWLQKEATLQHQQSVTYELLVPKSGGTLDLTESIPDSLKNKIVFGSVEITANAGSTAAGTCSEQGQGCTVTVMPGNDITITVTNIPVGKIYIRKEISNYRSELADDQFVIQAVSADDGALIDTQVVLKHGQTSAPILIKQTATVNLSEILPKEYSFSDIRLTGGGSINGSRITVQPGEEVTVTLYNTYSGRSFFHVSKAMTNIFQ